LRSTRPHALLFPTSGATLMLISSSKEGVETVTRLRSEIYGHLKPRKGVSLGRQQDGTIRMDQENPQYGLHSVIGGQALGGRMGGYLKASTTERASGIFLSWHFLLAWWDY